MNYFWNIPLFMTLSQQDQENLSDFCQIQHLSSGQSLFWEGDEAQALYVIGSWNFWVYKEQWGEKKLIANLWFWDIVGEMSFFWRPPVRNASVIAHAESTVITLLHYSLSQILEKYPNIHRSLQQIIEERSQQNAQK